MRTANIAPGRRFKRRKGTFSIAGVAEVAFVGNSIAPPPGVFSIAGTSTVAWVGAAAVAGAFAINSLAKVHFQGGASGAFTIEGVSEVQFYSIASGQGAFAMDGVSTVAFVGSWMGPSDNLPTYRPAFYYPRTNYIFHPSRR
jgi:hypothetical protein